MSVLIKSITELVIVIILFVFSAVYVVQQLRWANEQKERIKRLEKLINDGQTGNND